MKILKDFFKPKLIMLSMSEKIAIMISFCFNCLFLIGLGYAGLISQNDKDFFYYLGSISLIVVGIVMPLLIFVSLAGFGVMKQKCEEEKWKMKNNL